MTGKFQRSNQTIPLGEQWKKENMLKFVISTQRIPFCSTKLCLAYDLDRSRCSITDILSDEKSECIPERKLRGIEG